MYVLASMMLTASVHHVLGPGLESEGFPHKMMQGSCVSWSKSLASRRGHFAFFDSDRITGERDSAASDRSKDSRLFLSTTFSAYLLCIQKRMTAGIFSQTDHFSLMTGLRSWPILSISISIWSPACR